MQVIQIPKDHLTLFCCRRCRLTLLQGRDGVSLFSAGELHKLGMLRVSFRTGDRSP